MTRRKNMNIWNVADDKGANGRNLSAGKDIVDW